MQHAPAVVGRYLCFCYDFKFSITIESWGKGAPGWLSWYKHRILDLRVEVQALHGGWSLPWKEKKVQSLVFALSDNNLLSKYILGAGRANLSDPLRGLAGSQTSEFCNSPAIPEQSQRRPLQKHG